ncbi:MULTISPECIES: AraC family transcriptional regulator [unclassified Acidovorax]|uniref:AraC family transcriptional regulator n=1 Tax=unclassified Acidovorax TaxID=2684926 RepID=UPI0028831F29|nr:MULTISPECIES: AraC family transcriptional regulator [unclassified Acidovorax]
MHDFSSKPFAGIPRYEPETRDLLTQILLGLRLDGVDYGRCLFHAPWSVAFPAQEARFHFHFVSSGDAWLRTPTTDWLRLKAGDAVLLPHGGLHVLASAPDAPPIDIGSLARVPVSENIYLLDGRDPAATEAEASHVLFCGTLRFNLDPLHPLLAMMPEVMVAGDLARRDATVPALLDAMEREVALDRIGACGLLARLADALAASIIRAWVECGCNQPTGWIAAVRCPRIGRVIAAIHAAPERDWTVESLAAIMGASRSSFAEAFTRVMGETPARYVAKVKMFEARRWIARGDLRLATVAHRLGYESEASFSRAFKRIIGHAPSAARAA